MRPLGRLLPVLHYALKGRLEEQVKGLNDWIPDQHAWNVMWRTLRRSELHTIKDRISEELRCH